MWSSKIFSTLGAGRHDSVHRSAVYSAVRAAASAAASAKVETLRTTFVKPQSAIGRKECPLISFDLLFLGINYTQWMFTYRTNAKFEDVEAKLKDGLRVVLDNFYPLAGKIGKDEEWILKVEYDDKMNGVELKIAIAEDTEVRDMEESRGSAFEEEFIPYVGVPNYEGLHRSLLAVQLTKLKDGFALGCALNHAVVDGISSWHFLKAWADRCNDPTYVPITAFHDRTKVRNTRVKVDIPLNPQLTTTTNILLSQKVFNFTESNIDNIKSNTSAKSFSTFQCVAAHVWRAITLARQLVPEDYTVFVSAANIRDIVDPPMPETYFGNLVHGAVARTTAGDLYSSPPERSAALIQQSIQRLNSKDIHASETEWEIDAKLLNQANMPANFLTLGSSPKFRVYELDFGWGKPETVKTGHGYKLDGISFLNQGRSGGKSIDVTITLENEVMKRLEMDKDFFNAG